MLLHFFTFNHILANGVHLKKQSWLQRICELDSCKHRSRKKSYVKMHGTRLLKSWHEKQTALFGKCYWIARCLRSHIQSLLELLHFCRRFGVRCFYLTCQSDHRSAALFSAPLLFSALFKPCRNAPEQRKPRLQTYHKAEQATTHLPNVSPEVIRFFKSD